MALRRDGQALVLSGLAAGEKVAVKANFLLDSESRLRAAIAASARELGAGAAGNGPRGPADDRAPHRALGAQPRAGAAGDRGGDRLLACTSSASSGSTRCPISPTPRSSSIRAGTARPTSSRTRSPTRSSPSLLGAPKVKAVRGFSDFGFSYVYVIFEDGTDLYWARSRVLEYLSKIQPQLPAGVRTELGPDATGVGWVYQYVLRDRERQALARRAALVPGLDAALRAAGVPGRRRGRLARRLRQAVPDHRRPQPAGRVRPVDRRDRRRRAPLERRDRRPADRVERRRVRWCGCAATPRSVEEFAPIVVKVGPGRRAGAAARRGAGGARPGAAARRRRLQRHGRPRRRHRGHAPRRERARTSSRGSRRGSPSSRRRCPTGSRWSPPTTARC